MAESAAMRRRLRIELRRRRHTVGLTQREVADRLEWSPSKVIRIESGQVGMSVTDLRALAGLYKVDDDALTELETLARGSRRQPFSDYIGVFSAEIVRFFGYESSAKLIRHAQPLVVPGLLQTEDYTRALLKAFGTGPRTADRVVESRRERQELFERDEPPHVFTILDEGVLRRQVGGRSVMTRQLRHLIALNGRPNITIRVVPFVAGAYEALRGPFVHLEFPDASDPDIVIIDSQRENTTFIDDPEMIGEFQERFIALEDSASAPAALPDYVDQAIASW